jgi:hypothetical protein
MFRSTLPGSCDGAGVPADTIQDSGIIGLMRGNNAFQNGRFEGRRFVEFLPFEDAQRLTDDFSFVGITTGVDETIHKLKRLPSLGSVPAVLDFSRCGKGI